MPKLKAHKWYFALFLFVSSLQNGAKGHENSWFQNPKTTIYIENSLPDQQSLTTHCASKDDDLGVQIMPSNGTFQWSFRANFVMTTLYFCSFTCRDAQGGFHIYEARRDSPRCRHCSWVVRQDGVYGYSETKQNYLFFQWPKPPINSHAKWYTYT